MECSLLLCCARLCTDSPAEAGDILCHQPLRHDATIRKTSPFAVCLIRFSCR